MSFTTASIFSLSHKYKVILSIFTDTLCICFSYYLAFALRFDLFNALQAGNHFYPLFLLPVILLTGLVWTWLGLYRTIVRFVSVQSLKIVVCGAIFSAFALWATYRYHAITLPRSIYILYLGLLIPSVFGARFFVHYVFLFHNKSLNKCRVIIYGAGESGRQLGAQLRIGDFYTPVAFVDDNKELQGKLLQGVSIYPSDDIRGLVQRLKVQKILLAMPSETRHARARPFWRSWNSVVRSCFPCPASMT